MVLLDDFLQIGYCLPLKDSPESLISILMLFAEAANPGGETTSWAWFSNPAVRMYVGPEAVDDPPGLETLSYAESK